MKGATDMSFFLDILNSRQPVIVNLCIPAVSGAGGGAKKSNQESRVLGGRLSQQVHLSQEQCDQDHEDQEVVVNEEASAYLNAYATFTAHAARLSNLLQGCPHLVEKYSGLMAQLYAAATKDITDEHEVAPRHSSGSDGTISLCLETSRLRKKPKRLGSY
jgi:hypothetical protein